MPFAFDPASGRYVNLAEPAPAAPANPFALATTPGPDRVAISMDDAVSHLQDLENIYTVNDERIATLEQRLARTVSGAAKIDRTGFVGKTDREIEAIARAVGKNPFREGWAASANLVPGTTEWQRFVVEGNVKGLGSKRFGGETENAAEMRRELKTLRAANAQISAASEAMLEQAGSGEVTFYRVQQAAVEALPFGEIHAEAAANPIRALASDSPTNTGQASRRATAASRNRLAFEIGNEGGALVSEASVRSALDTVLAAEAKRVATMTQSLVDGAISLADWQASMMQSVKSANLLGAAVANGGWAGMGPSEYGFAGQRIRTQYRYLRSFAADIASGRQRLNGSAVSRAGMYVESGRATHRAAVAKLAQKFDAQEERNNLGTADHCAGCLNATSRGWVPIGSLVPCGSRDCLARCHCSISYRQKAA